VFGKKEQKNAIEQVRLSFLATFDISSFFNIVTRASLVVFCCTLRLKGEGSFKGGGFGG
jgi:hypothetical protein